MVSQLSVLHSESVLVEGGLSLFTELPRALILGRSLSASDDPAMAKITYQNDPFSS